MSLPLSAPDQPERPPFFSAIRREIILDPNTKNNFSPAKGVISTTSTDAPCPVKPGKTKT
jgi:hypothetical protein